MNSKIGKIAGLLWFSKKADSEYKLEIIHFLR